MKQKWQTPWPLRLSNASLIREFEAAYEACGRGTGAEARREILHEEISRRYANGTMIDDDWKIS
jgi:hypothetical protein